MVTTRSGRANNANTATNNPSPLQVLAPTPKRKRNARATSTPAPAPAPPAPKMKGKEKEAEKADDEDSDEDVGLFWQKNKLPVRKNLFPSPHPALLSPTPSPAPPHHPPTETQVLEQRAVNAEALITTLEKKIWQLQIIIERFREEAKANSEELIALKKHCEELEEELEAFRRRTGQVSANSARTDVDMSASTHEITANETITDETEAQAEFLVGSDDALALLRRIEASVKEPRGAPPSDDGTEEDSVAAFTPVAQELATPAPAPRPVATPQGFFSRSFSAIKSKLGFATPAAPTSLAQPPATAPANRPAPGSFTEALSAPPTPIGERRPTRPKKTKQNPMTKLLTTGVEPSDMAQASEWARHVIPDIFNRSNGSAVRSRLKTPVLIKDLEHFPSSKPWESGFGDPLGEMDDDDVVPVWAVYLSILLEEEEPKRKKVKSHNEVTMDDEDTPSLDELVAAASSTQSSPLVHDSRGTSVSHLDLHPRRSVEPSPLFSPNASHQQGNNIFREQQGQDSALNIEADREALRAATKQAVANHNPSQGSFGLDYDDEDEDSSILTDNSECDGSTSHLWTQPPPPAPVPAHAPLPGGAAPESPAPSQEQQSDEIERQRQKLMKHTPAKPSRLRTTYVPSPSLLSEAGNTSVLMGSPLAGSDPCNFEDMPDAEDLGLTREDWADVDAVNNDPAYQAAQAAVSWPDPIMTYESDEETLSPE